MLPTSAPSLSAHLAPEARGSAPLRVGFVLFDGLHLLSGGTIYDRMMVERLRARGDEVVVFALDREGIPARQARDLVLRLAEERIEVLVVDELCHRPAAHLFRMLERSETRTPRRVLLVHHLTSWERRAGAGALFREMSCVRRADSVVTTGAWAKGRLSASLESGVRIHVVEPGADRLNGCIAGPRKKAHDGPLELLFVGGVSRRKRVVELAHLASSIPGIRLSIVGPSREPELVAVLEKMASAAKGPSAPAVAFIGEVDDGELATLIRDSDALVLASELEGYGMVVTEALFLGTPVLVSNESGLPESAVDGVNARLFAFAELPAILADLARDRASLSHLREGAIRSRASLPNWQEQMEKFRAVLAS